MQLALALTFNRQTTHVERRCEGTTRTIAETGRNRVLCIGFSLKNGFAPKRERQKPSSRKTAMRSGPANPCARRDPCRFTALSLPSRHRNEPGRPARARPYQLAEPRRRRKRAWQSLLLACSQGARPESVSAGSHRPGLTKDDPLPVKPGGNRKVRRRPGNPAVAAQNPSAPFPGRNVSRETFVRMRKKAPDPKRGRALHIGGRRRPYSLPTKSMPGCSTSAPGTQRAGHTESPCSATNWLACTRRRSSAALRPMLPAFTS